MANKFLDLSGLTRLWAKAVEKFALKSHSHSAASTTAAGMMSAADKKKLESIDEGANKYTHPTTTGYRHIPSGGASGQILRWSEDGAAVWGADNNTTYGTGSATTAGIVKLYTGTGANTDGSMTQNAITNELNNKADQLHSHNYAGSSSPSGAATTALACTGNAATATILQTARTINGSSFNGSANITTAYWGAARVLTIGDTGKSVNGSIPVTWTLDEIGAQPMFQNQNLLYNTNYSISRASTATEPTSLTRGMPASMQFPDSYAAILGKTVTISFRAYSNASNVLYVRLSSDYDADILMELTATWGTTPEGGSTTTQVIGRCTMNATNAIYKTSSTYAPVFSETFTMPSSAPSGYSYLTSLSTSLILNARPTSGTIYALRPKLEVSARATPWCNELGSYLPLSGGTLSGATTFSGTATFNSTMTVSNSTIYPSIYLEPTNYNCRGVIETGGSGDISLQIYDKASDSTNRRALVLYSATEASNIINGLKLRACVSNTWTDYIVYHRGNLHYAEELPFWGTDGEICLVPIS